MPPSAQRTIPTTGLDSGQPPIQPAKAASSKAKVPPSEATTLGETGGDRIDQTLKVRYVGAFGALRRCACSSSALSSK
jgi:hypothetical protein